MRKCLHVLTAVCLGGSSLLCCAPAAHGQDDKPDLRLKPIEYKISNMAKEFSELEKKMAAYLEQVKSSDPDKAERLRAVIEQSRSGGTVEMLRAVTELLSKQDLKKASESQRGVVEQVAKLLAMLMERPKPVDTRELQRWQELANELRDLIKQEMRHEQSTEEIARAIQERAELQKAQKTLDELINRQEKELEATKQLREPSKELRNLLEARAKIRALIARQGELQMATNRAGAEVVTPETGPLRDRQSALQTEAQDLRTQLHSLAQTLSQTAGQQEQNRTDAGAAKEAADKTASASNSMGRASEKLGKTELQEASAAQTQALEDLRKAEEVLTKAVAQPQQPDANTFEARAQSQAALSADTKQLAQSVANARGQQRQQGPEAAIVKAAREMDEATEKLAEADKPRATAAQQQALDDLRRAQKEFADRMAELDKKLAAAQFDKMKDEQAATRGSTEKLSQAMAGQQGQRAVPGQKSVQNAAQKMKDAEQNLHRQDAAEANKDQEKAVEQLQDAERELQDAIDQARAEQQQEALAKIEVVLREMLEKQKKISTETLELDAKLTPVRAARKEPDRADLRKAQELAGGEGLLAGKAVELLKMLEEEGSTAVFPAVLREVSSDLKSLESYLAKADTGKVTQTVQASVEKNLEELIEALKQEQARRKEKKGGGGGGSGGGGGGARLVPPVAELKMLKMLQLDLNRRTKILDAARADRPELTETERAEIQSVSERQKKLSVMTNELKEKIQATHGGQELQEPDR